MSRNWSSVEMEPRCNGGRPRRGHAGGRDGEGFRDIGPNIKQSFHDAVGKAGTHASGMSTEQYVVVGVEIAWMVIFLVMTCINFADRITGMGEDAKYTMGNAPTAVTPGFDSAQQWYLFYMIVAILQAVYLIGMVIYHFMYRSPDSTQPNWEVHTRHYITAFCGNLLFRVLVCAMLASLVEQVRYDSVQSLTNVNTAVTATFTVQGNNGQSAEDAIEQVLQKLGTNAAYGHDLIALITSAASDAAKKSAIEKVAMHSVMPHIRAAFTAVQDMSLVLFLIMIPRAVTLLGKIVHDDEDAQHTAIEVKLEDAAANQLS